MMVLTLFSRQFLTCKKTERRRQPPPSLTTACMFHFYLHPSRKHGNDAWKSYSKHFLWWRSENSSLKQASVSFWDLPFLLCHRFHFWLWFTAGKMKAEFSAVFKWIMFNRWSLESKLFTIKLLIIGVLVWTLWNCKDAKNNRIPAWSSLISPSPSSKTLYSTSQSAGDGHTHKHTKHSLTDGYRLYTLTRRSPTEIGLRHRRLKQNTNTSTLSQTPINTLMHTCRCERCPRRAEQSCLSTSCQADACPNTEMSQDACGLP